ncbi:Bucentaur or craniofacial development [Geosmithia morbida]|uniref:SWR1-complex protein 5 n=1 Tax=Geosmithia morbida TaxID=1094350 RepID=A0A9P4YSL1_9HYPO|nr:Bucentaur or craniofacial development [Geosmithia morbida]KAF4121300.1 Bucentaur or craniofacial development [Geosmithia morbida]
MSAQSPDQDEEDDYLSSQDSDFAPDAVPADDDDDDDDASDSEDETVAIGQQKPKKQDHDDDAGYDNSGDETIIKKGEKRNKKKSKAENDDGDDDDGGQGGLIKTRRQRAAEKEERRVAAVTGPVTIDVDAVWAQMLSGKPITAPNTVITTDSAEPGEAESELVPEPREEQRSKPPSDLVRIRRTYTFAGKVHTEEKMVPRDSAEAGLYFAQKAREAGADADADADDQDGSGSGDSLPARRATKRAFRSAFEPLPPPSTDQAHTHHRTDLNLSVSARMQARREAQQQQQAKKLNTVEKSRMDWAGFVDKEGIKDELELAGRAKDSYASREDFLARSEARREEGAWKARMAGRV